jgi:hypothetical protein
MRMKEEVRIESARIVTVEEAECYISSQKGLFALKLCTQKYKEEVLNFLVEVTKGKTYVTIEEQPIRVAIASGKIRALGHVTEEKWLLCYEQAERSVGIRYNGDVKPLIAGLC